MAPGLVETYGKFKDRGVLFVGVSADPEIAVAKFIREMKIPWPCLCEMSGESLAGLGARGFHEGKSLPVLYVVAADGSIVWSDERARYYHEPPQHFVARFEGALEDLLKASAKETAAGDSRRPR